jgi:hypothetical protein
MLELHAESRAGIHAKCPSLLHDFSQSWNMSTDFSKTYQYQIL